MSKLLTTVMLLFSIATSAQSISAEEAKKLMSSLPESKQDTVQIYNLLKLAKFQIFKPGEIKSDLDSANDFVKRAQNINTGLRSKWADGYISLITSYLLKESGQRDKAKESAENAVAILKNEGDKNLAGEAYAELAGYFDYTDGVALTQRIELVKSAVSCFSQSGNVQLKAANLQMLGDLYKIKGMSFAALQQLQAALDAYNSINYKQVQGIYCLMGFIYARLKNYPKALDKELLALKTAQSVGDSSMQLCEIYNYLGEIHFSVSEKEKAIDYYEKAQAVAQKHHDNFTCYFIGVNIANVWAALKKPYKAIEIINNTTSRYGKSNDFANDYNVARCYISSYSQLKEFEKARPYVNKVLNMINSPEANDYSNMGAYTVVIQFFIAAGEADKATKYLEIHNELSKKMKDLYYLAANQKLRFMLDSTTHNYATAMAHLIESSRLNDSLSVQTKNRQIGELQVQFETKEKEDAINSQKKDIDLLTKQTQLQGSKIEKSRLFRNSMIAVAGLLLLILALVFRGYIIKKKNNRILSEQRRQIDKQNISLQVMVKEQEKLIDEKEWLLKEIHHRVKNNLQIVMSLLSSQSAYIDNEPALIAIHDSEHRVQAMSLIHQKLYNTDNVSSIDISVYIRELASYLSDSFNTGQRIRFEFDIEPLEMDVSQAVPLGLILNEAITNSIKYAFPKNTEGLIKVTLLQTSADHYLLSISDNGVGIPFGFDIKKSGSLGMSLMKGLSEDLGGVFSIENHNGTTIKISFVHDLSIQKYDTLAASLVSNN